VTELAKPYLLFLGDAPDELAAKTARGIAEWRPQDCLGEIALEGCAVTLGLPRLSARDAAAKGARTLVIGVANRGGVIPAHWHAPLADALRAGLDLASGLHQRLSDVPALAAAAAETGRRLIDVRYAADRVFEVGTGLKRSGLRLLTVGTDCSVGKMYTSLAIERDMRARGLAVDFRATGQTGILIAGAGVSVDAVIADFMSGAIEALTPANAADHWDVIEGQGSLFHPSYAGVSLALLHGAQPDALVMCHEPTRRHMRGLPHQPVPDLGECIAANLAAARLTNPNARFVGISLNTKHMARREAEALCRRLEDAHGLPCTDPVAMGVEPIVDNLLRTVRPGMPAGTVDA